MKYRSQYLLDSCPDIYSWLTLIPTLTHKHLYTVIDIIIITNIEAFYITWLARIYYLSMNGVTEGSV